MLLAVDMGNTNIVAGAVRDGQVLFQGRIPTDAARSGSGYARDLRAILNINGAKPSDFEGGIITSVVPAALPAVKAGVEAVLGKTPMVVGLWMDTGLELRLDNPRQVGSDRIVLAAAALAEYEPPLILIDMGTATTVEVVDEGNVYLGGCILPGVKISLEALSQRAAQLPVISLDTPDKVIGTNTITCMQSGVLYGAAATLDGLVDRMEAELGKKATAVVATGGLAGLITPLCRREIKLDPDLLLKGLELLYRRNI